MPATIHLLSASFATYPNGNNYRCLRCLRTFLFPLDEGDLSGKYVLVAIGRDQIWYPQPGDPDVPVGNHCATVENYTRADLQPGFATPRVEAYIVETDSPNCDGCGLGARYRVVGPDPKGSGDIAESTIYERPDDADDHARDMNRAYRAGVRMVLRKMSTEALEEMRTFAAAR